MFGSQARRVGAARFTPQLEELCARITPASRPSLGGEISYGHVTATAAVATVLADGSKPGIGSGSNAAVATGVWVGGPHGGRVAPFGGRGGMSGDLGGGQAVAAAPAAPVQAFGSKPGVGLGSGT